MAVPQRISIVTLGIADVARSTSFYESLGWHRSSASEATITFFSMQGSVLGLYQREALAEDAGVTADGGGFRGVTCALNLESTEAVDSVFAEWVAAGAEPIKAPQMVDWGGYSSYVADPDGHLWEIAHNPYTPFDAAGNLQLSD